MVKKLIVFDESWLTGARAKKSLAPSWAHEVMEALATTGGIYLGTLRLWFDRFPLNSNKQQHALKTRLESFNNEDHLGAVNELAWWVFMQRIGLQSLPVPTSSAPRPDFQVKTSIDFFVEVSTLNISKSDKSHHKDQCHHCLSVAVCRESATRASLVRKQTVYRNARDIRSSGQSAARGRALGNGSGIRVAFEFGTRI